MDWFDLIVGILIGWLIRSLFPIIKRFNKFMEKENEVKAK